MKLGDVVSGFSLPFTSLGAARTFAILVGDAALFDRRLCIQWDVYSEEHGSHSQLLRDPSQRGEVRRLVRTIF
jgi:hypothetical protein